MTTLEDHAISALATYSLIDVAMASMEGNARVMVELFNTLPPEIRSALKCALHDVSACRRRALTFAAALKKLEDAIAAGDASRA